MQWYHLARKCDLSPPELGSSTLATTPSFWRGFLRMLPALTTLIGFDGETDLFARTVEVPRPGACNADDGGAKRACVVSPPQPAQSFTMPERH